MKQSKYPRSKELFFSRWMIRIFGVVALALASSGCLSRPSMNQQTFIFSVPESPNTNTAVNGRVLAIRALHISPPFDGRALVYRTGEFSYERNPYAEFLASPADLLVTPVSEMLVQDGSFSSVVQSGGAIKPDAFVEININQLYGDIRNMGNPTAVLSMQVMLIDATNGLPGRVILQRNYSRRLPMKSTAPGVLMESWNQALIEIFGDVSADFRRQTSR